MTITNEALAAVPGIRIGHAGERKALTSCVDRRGRALGTCETKRLSSSK
ncbi:MAG: hypothetical protein J7551_10295 [Chloroflexi bacterium]|nr:hypothetical protein [Chloroflexota bacterium]